MKHEQLSLGLEKEVIRVGDHAEIVKLENENMKIKIVGARFVKRARQMCGEFMYAYGRGLKVGNQQKAYQLFNMMRDYHETKCKCNMPCILEESLGSKFHGPFVSEELYPEAYVEALMVHLADGFFSVPNYRKELDEMFKQEDYNEIGRIFGNLTATYFKRMRMADYPDDRCITEEGQYDGYCEF